MTGDEVPSEVQAFGEELMNRGFIAGAPWISSSFGEMSRGYHRGAIRLQMGRERGEVWFIQIATTEGHWYDPDIWTAALDGGVAPTSPSDLRHQMQTVGDRLGEIEANMTPEMARRINEVATDRLNRRIRPERRS